MAIRGMVTELMEAEQNSESFDELRRRVEDLAEKVSRRAVLDDG